MSAVGALFREVLSKMENDPRRVGLKENVDIFLWEKYNLMVRIMESSHQRGAMRSIVHGQD